MVGKRIYELASVKNASPQTVRKLILSGFHSPLLRLNEPQNHFSMPYCCFLFLYTGDCPPLSKMTFTFLDSLPFFPEHNQTKAPYKSDYYDLLDKKSCRDK